MQSLTLSKHLFFFYLYYALPLAIQFHLPSTSSFHTCATVIIGEQCPAYVDMSVMKHVAVLTTNECALMVTIQNTIPKAHGYKETSSNTEIKFEISYTSNLLIIFS